MKKIEISFLFLIGLILTSCNNQIKKSEEPFATKPEYNEEGEWSKGLIVVKESEVSFLENFYGEHDSVKVGLWKEYNLPDSISLAMGNYYPYKILDETFLFIDNYLSLGYRPETNYTYPKHDVWQYYNYENNLVKSEYYWKGVLLFDTDSSYTVNLAKRSYPNKILYYEKQTNYSVYNWYYGFNKSKNGYWESSGIINKEYFTNLENLIAKVYTDSTSTKVLKIEIYDNSIIIDSLLYGGVPN